MPLHSLVWKELSHDFLCGRRSSVGSRLFPLLLIRSFLPPSLASATATPRSSRRNSLINHGSKEVRKNRREPRSEEGRGPKSRAEKAGATEGTHSGEEGGSALWKVRARKIFGSLILKCTQCHKYQSSFSAGYTLRASALKQKKIQLDYFFENVLL